MYENGYKKLQDSLIDVIAEEQAKLGYMKEIRSGCITFEFSASFF